MICESSQYTSPENHGKNSSYKIRRGAHGLARMSREVSEAMTLDEIRKAMRQYDISQTDLSNELGVGYHSINRLFSKKQPRALKADEAEKIIRIIHRRMPYSEQERLQENSRTSRVAAPIIMEKPQEFIHNPAAFSSQSRLIPVYGLAIGAKGAAIHFDQNVRGDRVLAHPAQKNLERAFAVEIVDLMMAPRYEMGELAYANRGQAPRLGQDVVLELKDGGAPVRRFVSMDAASITVEQLNPPKKVTHRLTDVKAIHAVVGTGQR